MRPCRTNADSRARRVSRQDQPRRRTGAHQANAPDFSGQRPEAGADLDVELVEQVLAYGGLVDAVGYPHRVQRPQTFAFRRQHRKTERLQAGNQREVVALVPLHLASSPSSSTIASASSIA